MQIVKKKQKNYRPVSNLPFLSKMLGKVVLHQLRGHLLANNLSETFQSVYRAHHSTDTVLLDVTNCLLGSADEGRVSILPCSICQLHSIRWTTAFSLHACMTCLTYLARLLNGFHRICLIDSSLSASTVGSLHKRSCISGFLMVLSWAQYSLLCIHSHCLTFLKESAIITNLLTTLNFTNHQLHLAFIN